MVDFIRDETGQSIIESGLLVGLLSVVAIAALVVLGKRVGRMFEEINDSLVDITAQRYN